MDKQRALVRTDEPEQVYLSRKEVAAMLHVSTATIARWARARQLPYVRTLGGHRRYPYGAIVCLARELALPLGDLTHLELR